MTYKIKSSADPDGDICPQSFKVYKRRRKKNKDQASLWMDHIYLSLIQQDFVDPLSDLASGKNQPLDLM